MAFRIDFARPVEAELRRILGEQFGLMLECLDGVSGANSEDAVHELRTSTKKLRALLRLISSALPARDRRRWTRVLRSVSRQMSPSREYAVLEHWLRQAYQDLRPDIDPSERPWANLSVVRTFSTGALRAPSATELPVIRHALEATATEIAGLPPFEIQVRDLLERSAMGYGNGRRLVQRINDTPCGETLHDLRKCAKEQFYQLRLLRRLFPKVQQSEIGDFDLLGQLLGEHHDLANLQAAIARSRQSLVQLVELDGLRAWIDARTEVLQADALRLARRLYDVSKKKRLRALSKLVDRTRQR